MGFYKGNDLDNLIDLINSENVGTLPWPLDKTNFIFGKPQIIPSVSDTEANTIVRVQAKSSSQYRGSVDVKYRRINLATLFRGNPIHIHRYWVGTTYMTTLIPLINEKYGLNLKQDFGNGPSWAVSQTGQAKALSQHVDNYFYTGSANVFCFIDKEELGLDTLTVKNIKTVQWPGGNDFSYDRRGQMEFRLAGKEWTSEPRINAATGVNLYTRDILDFLADRPIEGYTLTSKGTTNSGPITVSMYTEAQSNSAFNTQVRQLGYPFTMEGYNTVKYFNPVPYSQNFIQYVENEPLSGEVAKVINLQGLNAFHYNA